MLSKRQNVVFIDMKQHNTGPNSLLLFSLWWVRVLLLGHVFHSPRFHPAANHERLRQAPPSEARSSFDGREGSVSETRRSPVPGAPGRARLGGSWGGVDPSWSCDVPWRDSLGSSRGWGLQGGWPCSQGWRRVSLSARHKERDPAWKSSQTYTSDYIGFKDEKSLL